MSTGLDLVDATDSAALYLAVIYAADGIRFITAARTHAALTERLTEYVVRNSALMLYEEDATRLRRMLATGDSDHAVHWYFECVGKRWEREYLHISSLAATTTGNSTDAASANT